MEYISGSLKLRNIQLTPQLWHCAIGISYFDSQILYLEYIFDGDENLRPVYKKTVLRNMNGCLHFGLFTSL